LKEFEQSTNTLFKELMKLDSNRLKDFVELITQFCEVGTDDVDGVGVIKE